MGENLKTGSQRIYIVGKVKITSPLHIGSGDTVPKPYRFDTDSPIKLDYNNRPYLPATAIGGLLRGTAENLITALQGWEPKHLRSLFGDVDEAGKQRVSRLRLHDAKIDESRWHGLDLRDGVGIDRQRASARAHALYNYEIVPAGSEFSLLMELRDGDEKERQLLTLTLEALNQLPSAIGAKGNSGLGALKLKIENVVTIDLTKKDELFKFLRQNPEKESQNQEFNPEEESGEDWETWRKNNLPKLVALKTDKQPPAWRIPQEITFTYRLKVKEPLLIRGREAPESALQDYQERKNNLSFGDDMRCIDATWVGQGNNPANLKKDDNQPDFVKWEPVIPGSSLRGVFRSHSERILRTLWWRYAGEDWEKYRQVVIASDVLLNPKDTSEKEDDYHLRSSGFEIQEQVSNPWQNEESDETIADFVWKNSDLGERMWGSSQWKSRVLVSEATIPVEQKDKWKELLFQNVAINRFTGGASEQKLFNALAVTHATFEGSITVFGDELWMIGLIALLFKDLADRLIRVGSGKTRGRGSFDGWLEKVEVKTLSGSNIAKICKVDLADSEQVWITVNADSEKLEEFPQNVDGWLKDLLEEGVKQLNKKVQAYTKEEEEDVRNHSSEEGKTR